jgi:hypothetical protein
LELRVTCYGKLLKQFKILRARPNPHMNVGVNESGLADTGRHFPSLPVRYASFDRWEYINEYMALTAQTYPDAHVGITNEMTYESN